MNRFAFAAVVAAATTLAAPAFANDTLARSLGVEPGTATIGQLITLRSAIENDDRHTARVIRENIENGNRATLSSRGAAPAANTQLSSDILLRSAQEDDNRHLTRILTARRG